MAVRQTANLMAGVFLAHPAACDIRPMARDWFLPELVRLRITTCSPQSSLAPAIVLFCHRKAVDTSAADSFGPQVRQFRRQIG